MREFRILGPLEARVDGAPVDLGGPRQRALLAALLVHHGQVVSTDRLVDLLWGEHAPKTATTSLQNAVSQLRRALGADVVDTRAPGYVFAADPAAIDAVRFESLVTQARDVPAAQRAQLLRSALALWRGAALADLAREEFTQGEIRRLEELRLDALEERIAADIELGLHREVIGELETLAAAAPLRERVCSLRMLALYRSGRQAEALQAFRDTRAAFVAELGIEPGAELQELHARILRQEAGLTAGGHNGAAAAEVENEILRALVGSRVVPVLGLSCADQLEQRLGDVFDVPVNVRGTLGRVTQYVAAMQGLGPLHDELHEICGTDGSIAPVHRLLARLPAFFRERSAPYQLIVTTAFDTFLERAFADEHEELDVVTYIAEGPLRGRFVHTPPGEEPRAVELPNAYTDLSLERRTVLLRLRGMVDASPDRRVGEPRRDRGRPHRLPGPDRAGERHPRHAGGPVAAQPPPLPRLRPVRLEPAARGEPAAGRPPAPYASWAVRATPSALELAFWRRLDVQAVGVDENAFASLLDGRLEGMALS